MKQNKFLIIIFLAVTLLFCSCDLLNDDSSATPVASTADPNLVSVNVDRVIDGDTIEVMLNGTKEKIRFIGVDTPESVNPDKKRNVPYGEISSEFTKQNLEGKTVELEFDAEERDQYGRVLAYVYLDGEMFNKRLVDEGNAVVLTYPPNVKYTDVFIDAQKQAREAKKGLWGSYDDGNVSQEGYVGNARTLKFHLLECQYAESISSKNIVDFDTRGEAYDLGYAPCKTCNP